MVLLLHLAKDTIEVEAAVAGKGVEGACAFGEEGVGACHVGEDDYGGEKASFWCLLAGIFHFLRKTDWCIT